MNDTQQQHPDGLTRTGSPERQPYSAPAIIYEGSVSTRAGSGIPKPKADDVAPEQLFGGAP